TVTVQAIDADGVSGEASFELRVYAAPKLNVASVVLVEGDALAATPLATDADSPEEELTFAKIAGPDWISVDPATGFATGDSAGNVGRFELTLRVTDAQGLSDDVTFAVTVRARPVLAAEDVTITQGTALSHPVNATDADTPADQLTFAKLAGPAWISVDAATGTLTGDSTGQSGEAEVTVQVTDADGLSSEVTLTVDVNAPPGFTLADTTLIEGAPLEISPTVSDPDNPAGSQSFVKVTGPGWIVVDSSTGAVTGDSAGQVGMHDVTVRITDLDGLSSEQTVTITVLARPELSAADATVTAGEALSVTPVVSDADSPAGELTFAKLAGPDWITIDPTTGVISGDSTGQAGEAVLTIRVTDADGLSDEATLTVDVNTPPVISVADVTLVEGAPVDVAPSVSDTDDPNGDRSFELVSGPDWIAINATTGQITGASDGHAGTELVTLRVTDADGLTAETSFTLRILAVPVISADDVTLTQGDPLSHPITASDADTPMDQLSFAKLAGPDWITIDPATGQLTGDSTGQAGVVEVAVEVSDPDGLSAVVRLSVDVNSPPVITAADTVMVEGTGVDIRPVVSDADDPSGARVFALIDAPDWLSLDTETGRITGDSSGHVGVAPITLRVTDADGLSGETTLTLTVQARPVLTVTDTTVVAGEALSHPVSAQDADSRPDELRYAKVSGPDWLSVDPLTGTLSGDTTGQAGVFTVTLHVTDPDGLSDEESLSLTVQARPILSGQDVTLIEGQPLVLQLTGGDADGGTEALRYEIMDGPDWIQIDAETGRVTGDSSGNVGEQTATFRVTDGDGLSTDLALKIDVNAVPVLMLSDITLIRGEALDLAVAAQDADGPLSELTFRLLAGPDWVAIDPASGRLTGDTTLQAGEA
ncbi:putative Ig domain-containing protein, partial [Cribrihabitans sp. XS_ASV171]